MSRVIKFLGSVFGILLAATTLLASSEAHATTPAPNSNQFRFCLKSDMSALVDRTAGDRATGTAWTLYGVNVRVELGGTVVQNWTYADPNDGCLLLPKGYATYKVKVRPRSTALDGNNTVEVRSTSGGLTVFSANATMGSGGTTYNVTMPSKKMLRVYTILAFGTERAFHGQYLNQDLTAWMKGSTDAGPCNGPGSRACMSGGDPHLEITTADAVRKFVVAHEYGHTTMFVGVGDWPVECDAQTLDGTGGSNANHRLRSREAASCAAGEGYAHFVAADMFNWHNSGVGSSNPQAEYQYLDDGIWNLGSGNGSCPSYPLSSSTAYPNNSPLRLYRLCTPSPLVDPLIGTEMDWARLFWDYHEDTSKPYSVRNHSQLHTDMASGGAWTTYSTFSTIYYGIGGNQSLRWRSAADWNGVCDIGVSC